MSIKKWAMACCLFTTTFAQAMEEDDLIGLYDDAELVSIATGTEKQIRFAPSVATVISSDDIKRVGARTLDEVLEMVPGLHVSQSFNRQDAIYSLRGIHTGQNPQVLLLIDGIRVQQLFSGARPYNFELPVGNIERVEVIRGPGSAVYGADAFAGVISVTTKTAEGIDSASLGVRAGSFHTQDVWVSEHEDWGDLNFDFSVQYSTSDGDRDQTVDVDVLGGAPFSLAPGPLETDIEHWHSNARLSDENWSLSVFSWILVDAGMGSGGAQALDDIGKDESEFYGAQYRLDSVELSENLSLSIALDTSVLEMDAEFVLLPPGTPGFPDGALGNPSLREETYAGSATLDFQGWEDHKIRMGIGTRYQDSEAAETKNFDGETSAPLGSLVDVTGTDEVFIKDGTREHYYAYLQDEWALANDWEATIGVRYDKFTQFGDSINPRIALVWATSHNLTTKLLYGRAFRAPSFSELFSKNNPSLRGNADLDPETIDTYEIAFDYRPDSHVATRLNFFYYEIDDLVEIAFDEEAENSGGQSGHGAEFEIDWDLSNSVNVIANYAWQDSEDDGTDKTVPSAPGQQAYISTRWQINEHRTLAVTANWVADRERASGDTRSDVDDYTQVDVVFRTGTRVEGLEIALLAKNIFDEEIHEPSGPEFPEDYPSEGQSFSIELEYGFGP